MKIQEQPSKNIIVLSMETTQKVEHYARSKYKSLEKAETLIVEEHESFFTVSNHKDGSPLILSKGVIE